MSLRNLLAVGLALGTPSALAACVPRSDVSPHFEALSTYMDSIQEELWPINQEIHANPELGLEEVKAHKLLTEYLESKEGWTVEKTVANLTTAFAAVFEGSGDGPVVSFNAEYDALPKIGHACGHNLIAMASLGGALATAQIMKEQNLPGKVVLFGTPAEEGFGGKVLMLEAGVYDDYNVDISLMTHPAQADTPYFISYSTDTYLVEYHGLQAHASAAPWEGINAQDAMNIAYNAVGLLRQQSLSTDQFHGIITSGGTSPNVIPALATGTFTMRAKNEEDLDAWTERVMKCFEAGAVATGAELNVTMDGVGYANMVNNELLASTYTKWFTGLGGELPPAAIDRLRTPSASTDQGDVSHAFPALSPIFGIVNEDGSIPKGGPHTPDFEVAAGSRPSFERSLRAGKAIAGTAIDVLTQEGLLDQIKEEFAGSTTAKRLRRR